VFIVLLSDQLYRSALLAPIKWYLYQYPPILIEKITCTSKWRIFDPNNFRGFLDTTACQLPVESSWFSMRSVVYSFTKYIHFIYYQNIIRLSSSISVREYRRGNKKWTIQRNWQHSVLNTKKNKTKTQHNMYSTPL